MRLMLSMTAGALALAALSGCGQSEEAFRAELRTRGIANCQSDPTPPQLTQAGIDGNQLCTCAIDRYMRATPIDQLRREQSVGVPPGLQTAAQQCMTDMLRRGTARAAPEANEAAPAEAPPAAAEEDGAAKENGAAQDNETDQE
jgi:hypothetical protein